MRQSLRWLNLIATALTLASALAVLGQDLLVPGYWAHHRDALWFVAAYCAIQAWLLRELWREGPWLPWLVAARAAAAYVFLLNLTMFWPEWRDWTPARYVYQLVDIPGTYNLALYALLFLGRGAFNTLTLLTFTDQWWRPLRRSHPFTGRLVTAGFVAGIVFPVWWFLLVVTEEAKTYSPEADAVAREVLAGFDCDTVRAKAGEKTSDLRRRGERHYQVEIAWGCPSTRVLVVTEEGRKGTAAGFMRECCPG